MQMFKWAHIGPASGTTQILSGLGIAVGRFDLSESDIRRQYEKYSSGIGIRLRSDGCF